MKLSINWLNSYFKIAPDWDKVLHKLTMAGLEVEGVEVVDDDKVVELKITPNRGDALSVAGLLREISVLTDYAFTRPAQNIPFVSAIDDTVTVDVRVPDVCPNYMTLIIKNIDNQAKLPNEILERLTRSGHRSVSPIVDISNYVMLELGQPLHAFDLSQVGNKLKVRFARLGERLELLVGSEAVLTDKTLVVCDSNDNPAAIAGVMGGANSGVSASTTEIILESALFIPDVIAGQAKFYGVSSDAAYRFERGVDSELQEHAIKYAASLIVKYCGGQIGQITKCSSAHVARQITLTYTAINRLVGVDIPQSSIDDILGKLGFILVKSDAGTLTVTVPSYRFDVTIKEDIIEEVARVYGYDNIEAQIPIARYTMDNLDLNRQQALKAKLANLGYSEIIGYAFVEESLELALGDGNIKAVRLQNPIANWGVMRTSLIADLVKVLEHNLNRGHKRMRIFELARVFHGETENLQPLKIAGLLYGNYANPNWLVNDRVADFYDLRQDVEVLLGGLGDIKFTVCNDNPVFHSGRCAKIRICGKEIGVIGQLHPKYKAKFGWTDLPYVFEVDASSVISAPLEVFVSEVSKFQKVERDLAFIMELSVNIGDVLDKVLSDNVPFLIAANVFDVYYGEKFADIKLNNKSVKSVAINFLFQAHKTLSEAEISASILQIQQCVGANFMAQLRM